MQKNQLKSANGQLITTLQSIEAEECYPRVRVAKDRSYLNKILKEEGSCVNEHSKGKNRLSCRLNA